MDDTMRASLAELDCPFNWGLKPKMIQLKTDFGISILKSSIGYYNVALPQCICKRFVLSIMAAFAAYEDENHLASVGRKLLDNAFRILAFSKDPNSPPPAPILPKIDDQIWETATMDEFYVACEKLECEKDLSQSSDDDEEIEEALSQCSDDDEEIGQDPSDGSFPLWNQDRFDGMYGGAENVAYSLKAIMEAQDGLLTDACSTISAHVKLTHQLSNTDRAFIYFVRATMWCFLTAGDCSFADMQNAPESIASAIYIDPSDIRWLLLLLAYLHGIRSNRHAFWGRRVEWKDVCRIVDVIDKVVSLKIDKWIEIDLLFEKLQALKDYMVPNQRQITQAESQALYSTCMNLCNHIVENTIDGCFLAYCAQMMSSTPAQRESAVATIERALTLAKDSFLRVYINAKACNVYRKCGDLEKALECAKVAAADAIGSNFQVLEIMVELGHDFDSKSFFNELRKKFGNVCLHREQIECASFLYYACCTDDLVSAVRRFEVIMMLSKVSRRNILGGLFCRWIRDYVHIGEAGYNVASHVLSKSSDDPTSEETNKICRQIVKDIGSDEKITSGFTRSRLTPAEYVDYLKGRLHPTRKADKPQQHGGKYFPFPKMDAKPKRERLSSWREEMKSSSSISDNLSLLKLDQQNRGDSSQERNSPVALTGGYNRQLSSQANNSQPWRSLRHNDTSLDGNENSSFRASQRHRTNTHSEGGSFERRPQMSTYRPPSNDDKLFYNWRDKK